jgi:NitT/TauT family transport system permease protein
MAPPGSMASPRVHSGPRPSPPPAVSPGASVRRRDNGTRAAGAVRDSWIIALAGVGIWAGASTVIGDYWVPSPWQTLVAFRDALSNGTLLAHVGRTAGDALLGLAAGFIPGITLPLLCCHRPLLLTTLEPFAAAGYALPKLALAPLFMLWLGLGPESTIAVVASSTFFLGYVHAAAGVKAVDTRLGQIVRVFGGASHHVRRYVVLPGTTPYVLAGLRLATSYAIGTAVIAEMLSSNRGLGYVVQFNAMNFDTAGVFAALAVVALLATVCDYALRVVEGRCTPWAERRSAWERPS